MLENFIETLCNTEGLVDIRSLGIPSQSSLYQGSITNGAYKAVSNVETDDFCFHTEKENFPWWAIEFPVSFNIQHIIINNRKRIPFNQIAADISVSCIDENGNNIVLYSGNMIFGALPEQVPLIVSLYNGNKYKKIIITLHSNNYLHLGNIHLLAFKELAFKELDSNFNSRLRFISNRTDGFGERLKALMNIIVLSNYTGGDFLFSWDSWLGSNKFHSTSDAYNIFDNSFLENHLVDKVRMDSFNLIPIKEVSRLEPTVMETYDGILVQQNYLPYQVSDKTYKFSKVDYIKAFKDIKFNSSMELARDYANKVTLEGKNIAIHLRSGDIVYGWFRFNNLYHDKVIPVYILDKIIQKFCNDGYKVILFGQEEELCKAISKKYDKKVEFSGELSNESFNKTQEAFFDILLMSRCDEIIAGSSGFAVLSSWISNTKLSNYKNILSNDEIVEAYYKSLSEKGILKLDCISPLLKSFSIFHFYNLFNHDIEISNKIELMNRLLVLDPENTYYSIILASLYYSIGNIEKGDKILINELISEKKFNIDWMARKIYSNNVNMLTSFIDTFKMAESKGSLVASIILLYYQYYYVKDLNFDRYNKILSVSKVKLGRNLLQEKLRLFKLDSRNGT